MSHMAKAWVLCPKRKRWLNCTLGALRKYGGCTDANMAKGICVEDIRMWKPSIRTEFAGYCMNDSIRVWIPSSTSGQFKRFIKNGVSCQNLVAPKRAARPPSTLKTPKGHPRPSHPQLTPQRDTPVEPPQDKSPGMPGQFTIVHKTHGGKGWGQTKILANLPARKQKKTRSQALSGSWGRLGLHIWRRRWGQTTYKTLQGMLPNWQMSWRMTDWNWTCKV